MTVIDYAVSKETFQLHYDSDYAMWHTAPKPKEENLEQYYQSTAYISHTDGRRGLFEKSYQWVKSYMLSRKRKLIRHYAPKGKTLLDIGAGTGAFLKHCKDHNWKAEGVEPNPDARARATDKEVRIMSSLNEVHGNYDVITLWHVLEHVYDLDEQLEWIKAHLDAAGTVFVAVPNYESYDAHYYQTQWAAYDVPRHLYHFSRKAIQTLFAEKNMKVIDVHPLPFDAYYVCLLSEKYKTKLPNVLRAAWVAWKSNRKAKRTGAYSSLIYVIKHEENAK